MDRRGFLKASTAVAGAAALAGPFGGYVRLADARPGAGYGPLAPVADHLDGKVRLELPKGFNYRSFHHAGTQLAGGGGAVPGRGDGMAVFTGRRANLYRIVRNHEVNGPVGAFGFDGVAYDPKTGGGTISVDVDRHGNVYGDEVSLNGTQMNCAGGRTPWGSWLSCEETVNGHDVGSDFTGASNAGLKKHGYVFEVPADGQSNRNPIRSAGRFAHEAAAVDPSTGIVYLTEDNFGFPSGFYRYIAPKNPMMTRHLLDGGVLQMLAIKGTANADLSVEHPADAVYGVEWVTIPNPDPTFGAGTTNDQAIVAVGNQGRAAGAAIFSRLEGAVYDRGEIYFVSTQGGPTAETDSAPSGFGNGRGQVWAYNPATSKLRLAYQSPGSAVLDLPDNVTATRSGALVLCEDGSGDNFLRGLTPGGELFDFARNADPAQAGQEFAGAAFGPDFHTLFVNIQSSSGYSMAIWGPWARGPFA